MSTPSGTRACGREAYPGRDSRFASTVVPLHSHPAHRPRAYRSKRLNGGGYRLGRLWAERKANLVPDGVWKASWAPART